MVVAFSGGKDSIAALLTVLEAGVPSERIDVYHHDVDGAGPSFMDWPCNTVYCRAVTDALGVPLYLSWKEGGFLREMLRDGVPTAPICFQTPEGTIGRVGGTGPAPAYRLGWSRLSCIACIFGNADQWASMRYLAPVWFERIATHEDEFGRTIQRHWSIRALADRGRPYQALIEQPELVRLALQHAWSEPVLVPPVAWTHPAGAFGEGSGPS